MSRSREKKTAAGDEIRAWSSFRFGSLWIIESLPEGERNSGENLARRMRNEFGFAGQTGVEVRYEAVDDEQGLRSVLQQIAANAPTDGPMLHLEMHGDEEGMELANGDVVRWPDLRHDLTPINVRCGNNLFVTLAVCCGEDLKQSAVTAAVERAPFFALLGTDQRVKHLQLSRGFDEFYKKLLIDHDFMAAREAINEIRCEPHATFSLIPAELVLRMIVRGALDEYRTPEARDARVERLVQRKVREQGGVDGAFRDYIRNALEPENQVAAIEDIRRKFMMIDLYPEVADRSMVTAQEMVHEWLTEQATAATSL